MADYREVFRNHTHHLYPGEAFISLESKVISTVLGSCVAVCLWDEKRKIGGMNHVMLPICREEHEMTTKFANVATYVLYDLFKKEHCFHRYITAKVYGGACGISQDDQEFTHGVGARNIEVTQMVLKKLKIPIVAQDVGEKSGRKILFDTSTGSIEMSFLRNYSFTEQVNKAKSGNCREQIWK